MVIDVFFERQSWRRSTVATQRVVVDCNEWRRLDLGVLSALIHGAKACALGAPRSSW